jgi:hypothetical protein
MSHTLLVVSMSGKNASAFRTECEADCPYCCVFDTRTQMVCFITQSVTAVLSAAALA